MYMDMKAKVVLRTTIWRGEIKQALSIERIVQPPQMTEPALRAGIVDAVEEGLQNYITVLGEIPPEVRIKIDVERDPALISERKED